MGIDERKLAFLRSGFLAFLDGLSANDKGNWGKMNAQQMTEHLADFFNVSSGMIQYGLVTPAEHLPKYKEFLLSEKQFRENTKAPVSVLGEEPLPVKRSSMKDSVEELHQAVEKFFLFFEKNPGSTTVHPVFGELNFEEWILLHYKHVTHHLRQFGWAPLA